MWLGIIAPANAWWDEITPEALRIGGDKQAGATFLDWDDDGDYDLAAPGDTWGESVHLVRNDGAYGWTDVTGWFAPELLDPWEVRGLLAGDLDHDGRTDLVRIAIDQVDVFRNDGGSGFTPVWSFPLPNNSNGFEGAALLDRDGDGWLDLLVTEAEAANWILFNRADGTAAFDAVDESWGLVPCAENSDFATAGDWDADGDPDVVIRGDDAAEDAFLNDGTGAWRTLDLALDPYADDKGAVVLRDTDLDGDLDLHWTTNWEDPGVRTWDWDPRREQWVERADFTQYFYSGFLSIAFGDFDHDGLDDAYGSGPFDSVTMTTGETGDAWYSWYGNGIREGLAPAVADVDNDGDLDVYDVAKTGESRLMVNHLVSTSWMQFRLRANVGTCEAPIYRDDIGGAARLWSAGDAADRAASGRLEISGGQGRGQSAVPVLHVGGVDPWSDHELEVDPMVPGLATFRVPIPGWGPRRVDVLLDDPDQDGVPTAIEALAPADPDGDGILTPYDEDSDGDGLPDWYESGGPCGARDTDGDAIPDLAEVDSDDDGLDDPVDVAPLDPDVDDDGLVDGDEIAFGTDPFDPDTDGGGRSDGEEFHLDWTDPLDGSDDLRDSDDDGISDIQEGALGTDPYRADTDGDGLGDGDEAYVYETDPLFRDTDADGLDDPDELALGTSPTRPDTDRDGLTDGDEAGYRTDPLEPDTDGDGVTDGTEIADGTDPRRRDSDVDGLDDGVERDLGTDPLNGDTDGDGMADGEDADPLVAASTEPEPGLDTDGDGIADLDELGLGTDPTKPDTDADGVLDGADPDPLSAGGIAAESPPAAEPGFGLGCATSPRPSAAALGLIAASLLRRRAPRWPL